MHLSKKAEYALRAMIHLGIASELGLANVAGVDLAEANRLPLKFVERILQELRDAGLVEAKRGKSGGYSLGCSADAIRIGDLVRLMDGRLAPICCASEGAYQRCTCPDEDHCGLRMLMIDVRNAIASILDRYTLSQVVEVTLRKMRRDGVAPPFANLASITEIQVPQRRRADPADGFLAGLSQLATHHETED
ncbi:Rrf2 family protein [Haloferula luteola]|uniref:Rrf2 family protein n=1 Tax=Haloferula luteola TaxID=595692 RepID=A0A840V3A5_9BACT|nr:Rrf2 family transcriptional regulator [Haloferula luteola]MBB5350144.1 Rrf2 family protein [Haloferula luteola]